MANEKSRFGAGIILGTAIGALAALFLSPKSGKENREMVQKRLRGLKSFIEEKEIDAEVKKMFGDVTTQSKKLYTSLQSETNARMDALRAAIEDLDTEKYKKQVAGIIDQLRKDGGAAELLEKAQKYLMTYIKTEGDKVTKGVGKAEKELTAGAKDAKPPAKKETPSKS